MAIHVAIGDAWLRADSGRQPDKPGQRESGRLLIGPCPRPRGDRFGLSSNGGRMLPSAVTEPPWERRLRIIVAFADAHRSRES
jgi:hypothetical protein